MFYVTPHLSSPTNKVTGFFEFKHHLEVEMGFIGPDDEDVPLAASVYKEGHVGDNEEDEVGDTYYDANDTPPLDNVYQAQV